MIKIKIYDLLIPVLLLAGPFIDMLNGFFIYILNTNSNLNPGVLIRGVILLVFIFFSIKSKHRVNFVNIICIALLLTGSSYHLLVGYDINLYQSLNRYSKALLPIVGFVGIKYLDSKSKINDNYYYWKLGFYYGLITVLGIIIFTITDVSVSSYQYQSYSSKGILKAQNDTSLIIIISYILFLGYNYYCKNNSLVNTIFISCLYFYAAFYLSTRSVLIGLPISFIIYQLYILITKSKNNNLSNKVFSILLVSLIFIVSFKVVEFWINNDVDYLLSKFEALQEGDFRRSVPFGIEMIKNFTILEHLFGIGDVEFLLTENDIVDLYGKFGILLFLIIISIIIIFYFRIIELLAKSKSISSLLLTMAMSVYVIHGALAGHAFASSQVNSLMIIIYFLIYKERFN